MCYFWYDIDYNIKYGKMYVGYSLQFQKLYIKGAKYEYYYNNAINFYFLLLFYKAYIFYY